MAVRGNPSIFLLVVISLWVVGLIHLVRADVGTASRYDSPYLPSACYGTDASQYPSSMLFAAAGEGIWDNGAACGRRYLVSCISATTARVCNSGRTIQIKIVDRAATMVSNPMSRGATLVLSTSSFKQIANPTSPSINIEFRQV